MSKTAAWFTAAEVAAAVIAALLFLASMRYSVAPVDPPLPVPDYELQAIIAYAGSLPAVAIFVATGVAADKSIDR
ncbi:hypothetical protein [Arthrobacter sulfonylureivorans]|uniref:Uncharacterized protein n=1 Tax=Arthrobacter sulfonylureivorans TaxID=2486855 RepID=A0ABY3WAX7_9MICC|nr:hypothetical protein [Arthrobacter sulfonylureivorans]UNK45467.1 hypothetical protein MNQ99_16345 [Arthrobacter sulfonylureivorans]